MRHAISQRKLGRKSGHRNALFRNQLLALLEKERIVTTLMKAKELRPIAEKMITLGKTDSVHSRRLAARSVHDAEVLRKLFENISPRFAERPGGYTRIIKLGPRRGDGAEMAIIELVDYEMKKESAAPAPKTKKAKAKPSDEETAETPDTDEGDEDKPAKKKPAAKKAPAKKAASKKAAPKKASSTEDKPKKAAAKKAATKKSSKKPKK